MRSSASRTYSERASLANAKHAIDNVKVVRRHDKSVRSAGIPSSMACFWRMNYINAIAAITAMEITVPESMINAGECFSG